MKKIIALSFLLLATFQIGNAQSFTRKQVIQLSEVHGFLYGQKITLEWIKQNFPDLRNNALQAELKWKLEFGKVETEVQRQLKEIFEEEYDNVIKLSIEKYKELHSFDNLTKVDAVAFIETVNQRAKGNIEEYFRAKILVYHPDFIEDPYEEFSRGYRNKYSSTGNEVKSKGIKIKFEYPASWLQQEGERPNVLFKAVSKNGDGQTALIIVVKDLKEQFSKEELNRFVSKEGNEELANMIFNEKIFEEMYTDSGVKEPKYSDYKRVEIDGNPGAKINVSGTKKRLDFEIAIKSSQYTVLSKNYLIILGFSITGLSQEQTKIEFDKHQVLFSLIMNSLIILNKYE